MKVEKETICEVVPGDRLCITVNSKIAGIVVVRLYSFGESAPDLLDIKVLTGPTKEKNTNFADDEAANLA